MSTTTFRFPSMPALLHPHMCVCVFLNVLNHAEWQLIRSGVSCVFVSAYPGRPGHSLLQSSLVLAGHRATYFPAILSLPHKPCRRLHSLLTHESHAVPFNTRSAGPQEDGNEKPSRLPRSVIA